MEKGRRRHIPAFGEWNQQCEELPITQYFESAMQHGLVVTAGHYYHAAAGELLFKVAGSPPPQKPPKKVRSTKNGMENQAVRRRDGPSVMVDGGVVVHGSRRPRVVRAVDEDLYKVPSELLRKKAKGEACEKLVDGLCRTQLRRLNHKEEAIYKAMHGNIVQLYRESLTICGPNGL